MFSIITRRIFSSRSQATSGDGLQLRPRFERLEPRTVLSAAMGQDAMDFGGGWAPEQPMPLAPQDHGGFDPFGPGGQYAESRFHEQDFGGSSFGMRPSPFGDHQSFGHDEEPPQKFYSPATQYGVSSQSADAPPTDAGPSQPAIVAHVSGAEHKPADVGNANLAAALSTDLVASTTSAAASTLASSGVGPGSETALAAYDAALSRYADAWDSQAAQVDSLLQAPAGEANAGENVDLLSDSQFGEFVRTGGVFDVDELAAHRLETQRDAVRGMVDQLRTADQSLQSQDVIASERFAHDAADAMAAPSGKSAPKSEAAESDQSGMILLRPGGDGQPDALLAAPDQGGQGSQKSFMNHAALTELGFYRAFGVGGDEAAPVLTDAKPAVDYFKAVKREAPSESDATRKSADGGRTRTMVGMVAALAAMSAAEAGRTYAKQTERRLAPRRTPSSN